MEFKNIDIIDVIGDVVDSLRESGTFSSAVYASPYTTFTVTNTLKAKDIITIDSVDYIVFDADSTKFRVSGDLSTKTAYKSKAPYYEYGHILEIANKLSKRDKSTTLLKFQKYPVVILQLDVQSTYNKLFKTFDYENVKIYIATKTDKTYSAKDRKELKFEPILYPLYENFISGIKLSESIDDRNNIPFIAHTKTDRFFWGTQLNQNSTANILNDYLDAIEIGELNINIKNINC